MKKIIILGTGCSRCNDLMENTEKAVKNLNLDCEVEKVSDLQQIMKYGVMMVPALVIDDEVKLVGKVPSVEELKDILFNE